MKRLSLLLALLPVVCGYKDGQTAEFVGTDRVRDTGAAIVQLFDDQAAIEDAEFGAAQGSRDAKVHQACGKGFFTDIARENLVLATGHVHPYEVLAVLKRGRELLGQLRDMLEDPLLRADDHDPLTVLHVEIASMLDVLLLPQTNSNEHLLRRCR